MLKRSGRHAYAWFMNMLSICHCKETPQNGSFACCPLATLFPLFGRPALPVLQFFSTFWPKYAKYIITSSRVFIFAPCICLAYIYSCVYAWFRGSPPGAVTSAPLPLDFTVTDFNRQFPGPSSSHLAYAWYIPVGGSWHMLSIYIC